MDIKKIQIKNFLGIEELNLSPNKSYVIKGKKGVGKTSVIDAIRLAFTNKSNRPELVRKGEEEAIIYIETSSGLEILKKRRVEKTDYDNVQVDKKNINSPQAFLKELFDPIQFNPIKEFYEKTDKEKKKILLSFVEYDWDLELIKKWFGEVVPEVDYSQHILNVLEDIQSKDGYLYLKREGINRAIKSNTAVYKDKLDSLPDNYNADDYRNVQLAIKYDHIAEIEKRNNAIRELQYTVSESESKRRKVEADFQIDRASIESKYNKEQNDIIEELAKLEKKKTQLKERQNSIEEIKAKEIQGKHEVKENILNSILSESLKAEEDLKKSEGIKETTELREEARYIENMKSYVRPYDEMKLLVGEIKDLEIQSEILTEKITLARELPTHILEDSNLPIESLKVIDGEVLINDLPIENLSDGEKYELAIDIAIWKKGELNIILLDGFEKLDSEHQAKITQKLFDKKIQFIATMVSDTEIEYIEVKYE